MHVNDMAGNLCQTLLAAIMVGCASIGAWVTLEGAAALAPAALSRLAQELATVRAFAQGWGVVDIETKHSPGVEFPPPRPL